jgi:hypothetical protein
MKLNTQQIEQLYAFTRQHYVEWYDLQSELVDHLANAIEQEWEQNPNDSFDQILNIEFKKFGVFGFMNMVDQKRASLNIKYARLIWGYYKEFFRLPKIILTIALIFGVHTINQLVAHPDVFTIIAVSLFFISGFFAFKIRYYLKQKTNKTGRKWLFEEITVSWVIALLFLLPSLFNIFNDIFTPPGWSLILREITFVLVGLLIFIQLTVIPKKVATDLAQSYPEYSLHKA